MDKMSTLVEKYRPKDWDEVEGNDWIISVLQRMIDNNTTQHMIFVGQPGCGKTTLARIFASKYLGDRVDFSINHDDYRELNASDERGIDIIRGRKVKQYCQSRSNTPGKKRVLFLDEADGFTQDSQRALRAIMENNQQHVVIIMSVNHLERITEKALLSRCTVFKFEPVSLTARMQFLEDIARKEGIEFESQELICDIVAFPEYKGDFRRILNDTLQKLIGIDHEVTYKDIPWISEYNYNGMIKKIIENPTSATNIFFSEYIKRYIDPLLFMRQLFEAISNPSFKLSEVFAEVEYRIKQGGDDLIQLTYLLKAVENG